ncbi:MAG: MarR family winged helix-turn-helix transcriptional regulator [Myxococcota bacterium]
MSTGLNENGPLFLGRAADRLSSVIEEQTEEVFLNAGIVIPVRSCSFMVALAKQGSGTVADLAHALRQSHQLVAQKVPKLLKLRLISQSKDRNDARRKLLKLTRLGQEQLDLVESCGLEIERAYTELFSELGDLSGVLNRAIDLLEEKPLSSWATHFVERGPAS